MTDTIIETPDGGAADPEMNIDDMRSNQNFALAIPAGLFAALVGAVLWALFVYFTEMQLGLIAIAVGALTGFAIRYAGQGVDKPFGILGGVCAALGWALGTVLCDIGFAAREAAIPFLEALTRLGFGGSLSLALSASDGMDILFLAIAVWEGYKFSFRYRPN